MTSPYASDRDLRELLLYLRDTFRDSAARIDTFLAAREAPPQAHFHAPAAEPRAPQGPPGLSSEAARERLDALREEVRALSLDAPGAHKALLRLQIEAITAETRALQPMLTDPEDHEGASRIMRTLTAIVSDHRPGHVYGLARHHQAVWTDVARRARADIEALKAELKSRPEGAVDALDDEASNGNR
ncbi:MAG: hypothetical protein HY909_22175 [Deltaproteobacteria bacterium]|nr:hypothetical protein [Deltaproteobacteria bacterium]